ncbi:MAG: phosphohistidine phosphatase SixA [Desulfobacteraceae bacterium]|nr:phosphohistidine phosphatase SixA [Desulfobacteraceae bacterium]
MALYLIQHGKSLSKNEDPEQALSQTGIAETQQIAEVASNYQISVKCIHHSTKTRARQTAKIFAKALCPLNGIRQIEGINPMGDVTLIASGLKAEQDLMLVGHMPFMSRLTAYLITGNIEPPVFRFQNSGIVCLDKFPDDKNWQIVWALMPRIA